MWEFEQDARNLGYCSIAGGDEAGRGPWAGPVCAAFVVLPWKADLPGLTDSKALSRSVRQRLFHEIRSQAMSFGIAMASVAEIDRVNILEATRLAFARAFEQMWPKPDFVLLDYLKLPWLELPHRAYVRGDRRSASIAAASILAKESRDLYMENLHRIYPDYGFAQHKGYGTQQHRQALDQHGPCPAHRRSFRPIRRFFDQEPRNESLF